MQRKLNEVLLIGYIGSDKKFSHEIYGEKFYTFTLNVKRQSEVEDKIPIIISERLPQNYVVKDTYVIIHGQVRTYKKYEGEKVSLLLQVFCTDIQPMGLDQLNNTTSNNKISIIGRVNGVPLYRLTPMGREICDLKLRCFVSKNEKTGREKSYYIPCILWGRNAKYGQTLEAETELKITGRLQSREYLKQFGDGTTEDRITYEVSVETIEVINNEGN